MAKVKTQISMEENMMLNLKKQAKQKGLDVSAYITYLVGIEEDRREQAERLEMMINKMLPGGIKDIGTLAQLIQNKGDE